MYRMQPLMGNQGFLQDETTPDKPVKPGPPGRGDKAGTGTSGTDTGTGNSGNTSGAVTPP